MPILTLGISFRRAPIELLERLSFADDELVKAYRHALDMDAVDEAVILSTCNRVEITANVPSYHAGFLALKRVLTETRGVAPEELAEPLYSHWEQDAADHLFAVAAGLDSMVIGETQIHAQVREALRTAEAEGASGPAMRSLFHAAARAGRRARAETSLGAAPDAFVALGADLAEEELGDLRDRHVVVVGAGRMAGLAVQHLHGRGVGSVRVLNRSLEHARALAERTGDDFAGLDHLPIRHRGRGPGGLGDRRRGGGDRRRDRRCGARTDPYRSARPAGPGRPSRRRPRRRGAGWRAADRHPRHPRTAHGAGRRHRRRHRSGARDRGRGGPAVGGAAPLRRARPVDPSRAGTGRGGRPLGARPLCKPSLRPDASGARGGRSGRAWAWPRSSCTTRSSS